MIICVIYLIFGFFSKLVDFVEQFLIVLVFHLLLIDGIYRRWLCRSDDNRALPISPLLINIVLVIVRKSRIKGHVALRLSLGSQGKLLLSEISWWILILCCFRSSILWLRSVTTGLTERVLEVGAGKVRLCRLRSLEWILAIFQASTISKLTWVKVFSDWCSSRFRFVLIICLEVWLNLMYSGCLRMMSRSSCQCRLTWLPFTERWRLKVRSNSTFNTPTWIFEELLLSCRAIVSHCGKLLIRIVVTLTFELGLLVMRLCHLMLTLVSERRRIPHLIFNICGCGRSALTLLERWSWLPRSTVPQIRLLFLVGKSLIVWITWSLFDNCVSHGCRGIPASNWRATNTISSICTIFL